MSSASVDMKKLLSLPQNERRKIAEKLWNSLTPTSLKEDDINLLLEKRWQNIKSGKSQLISSIQFWEKIEAHLASKNK